MTHNEKLDKLLNGLLSRIPIKIKKQGRDDERLTFDFLCNVLFQEGHEPWETEYIKRRLLADGLIQFYLMDGKEYPEITDKGIKFIIDGGYKQENITKKLENELRIYQLKALRKSNIALYISAISLILAAISTITTFFR
jgi:hypothetical protein